MGRARANRGRNPAGGARRGSGRHAASPSISAPAISEHQQCRVFPPFYKAAFSGPALWISVALVAAIAAVYAPVWHHQFVDIDDVQYIPDNPVVLQGLTWRGVQWALTTGYGSNWFPLTWLSHMLDVQLYGLNAGAHHLTSLLLHIFNTLLLFALLRRTTNALGRSAFVAAMFALHPLHVESVAWVAERKDVLSTLFLFLALWAYISYVQKPVAARYLLVMLAFALGLMSKPMLVTLPFVLLLLDIWPLGRVSPSGELRPWWRPVWEKVPLVALAAASSTVTYIVQQKGGSLSPLDRIPLGLRLENALVSYAVYIANMLWPARLAAFYPYPVAISTLWAAGAAGFLVGISAAVLAFSRRHRYLLVGWCWYLGMLVPVIGLVQVGGQSRADRYTYVPLIGLLIIVAWGMTDLLAQWPHRRQVLTAVAIAVALACAAVARRQVAYWKDPVTLWTHALEVTAGNFPAHNNLGLALAGQGKLDEAVTHYREALRIKPAYARGYLNLGAALASQGKIDEAIAVTREAARFQPDYADAYYNLGVALEFRGKTDEAIREYLEGLRIEPDHADWHYKVAVLLAQAGKTEEAEQHFEKALALDPGHQEARRALENLRTRGHTATGAP